MAIVVQLRRLHCALLRRQATVPSAGTAQPLWKKQESSL